MSGFVTSTNGGPPYLFTPPPTGRWAIYSIQREIPYIPSVFGAHNYLVLVTNI